MNVNINAEFQNEFLERMKQKQVTIAVLGLGYVGLPTALGFAELGWRVLGADVSPARVETVQNGEVPFYEPGIGALLGKHLGNRFTCTSDIESAIQESGILFLCVGTPQRNNGEADLQAVEALARTIARNMNSYKLIIEKSTVPAITGHWINRTIQRYRSSNHTEATAAGMFDVASNPEFLQEGKATEGFFHPERIVCGVESPFAKLIVEELFSPFTCPLLITGRTTAELIKHAANAFLAMKISFMNLVSDLCEQVDGDAQDVAVGIGLDSRIGKQFLRPGLGFGGYCLPKDLRAFSYLMKQNGVDPLLLEAVEQINDHRIDIVVNKIRQALWVLEGKTIGILGLAFKAGTDDVRESQSIRVVKRLQAEGANVRLYDPQANEKTELVLGSGTVQQTYCSNPYQASAGADCLAILTDWPEFLSIDFGAVKEVMQVPVIVDARNVLDCQKMHSLGFEYHGIGIPPKVHPIEAPLISNAVA